MARRLAGLSGLVLADPSSNGHGFGKLGSRRLPDLGHEIRQICIGLLRQLRTAHPVVYAGRVLRGAQPSLIGGWPSRV